MRGPECTECNVARSVNRSGPIRTTIVDSRPRLAAASIAANADRAHAVAWPVAERSAWGQFVTLVEQFVDLTTRRLAAVLGRITQRR
jgi:hypothetical protein